MKESQSVRQRLLVAAQELLANKDAETITSRDIASHAGVGIGNINYHFQSKDNLITQAVGLSFQAAFDKTGSMGNDIVNPKEELEQLLYDMFAYVLKFKSIGRYVLKHKMTNRTFHSERYIMRYIAAHYQNTDIDHLSLKLKALQINAAVMVAFFNSAEFYKFCETDLYDEKDLKKMLHVLVENTLC